jgi:hypothetical protein
MGRVMDLPANWQKTNDMKDTFQVLPDVLPFVVNADTDPYFTGAIEPKRIEAFVNKHGPHWAPVMDAEHPDDMVQCMGKCDVTGHLGWCFEIQKT